jgi:hypothetical protein
MLSQEPDLTFQLGSACRLDFILLRTNIYNTFPRFETAPQALSNRSTSDTNVYMFSSFFSKGQNIAHLSPLILTESVKVNHQGGGHFKIRGLGQGWVQPCILGMSFISELDPSQSMRWTWPVAKHEVKVVMNKNICKSCGRGGGFWCYSFKCGNRSYTYQCKWERMFHLLLVGVRPIHTLKE